MKKIVFLALAAIGFAACSPKQAKETNETKDMNQLSFTTGQAAWMSAIACHEAKGDLVALESAIHNGLEAELTVSQVKEALSQLYAYTGFPRSLNALGTLQRVIGDRQAKGVKVIMGEDASPLPDDYDALQQGTEVQTRLTGKPFDYAFAPATDYYLKAHLFGDIFARDNLTFADRELVTVSALSGLQGVEPQLKAHIAGARNMGVTEEQLQGIAVALAANGLFEEAGRLARAYDELSNSDSGLTTKWSIGSPNTAYSQYFIGQSFLQPYYGGVANVTFEPRCRNNWHVHHGAVQVLVCVSGKGWYQEWGKPAVALTSGTVIAIPEGVKHWHGAAADSWMQHLAVHTQEQPGASNEWLEPVSDKQYNCLTACAKTNDTKKNDSMTKQNILVTYFSWSGNTRYAAEYIANRLGADQFEIIREEAYPADYDACAEHAKAEKERGDRPAIKGKVDMADNLNVFDFALTDEEMQQIAAIDKGKSVFFSHQDPAIVEWFGQMVEERKKANHHPAKEQTKW